MPSGRLCSVTARVSIEVRESRAPGAFGIFAVEVKVRGDVVEQQQEAHASQETYRGRHDRPGTLSATQFDTGNEQ